MKVRFHTESGSLYELNKTKMTWERLLFDSDKSPFVRTRGGDLVEWPNIEIGKSVNMFGTALNSTIKEMGGARWISTTPVVSVENL